MLNDKIAEFAAHLRENERAAATVEKYVRDVRAWQEWSVQSGEWSCTKENVIAYKSYLTEQCECSYSI